MHRLHVAYPPPADPARFLDYYVSRHVPLARTLPGLLDCRFYRPQMLGPATPVFLVFEADFRDEPALMAALISPTGAQVAADVPNYSPGGATLMHYAVPAP